MPVEWWKSFFEFGGVVLLFLTFAFGAGFMLTGKVVNERQERQLRQFDKDLTDAKTALGKQQERAANADAQVAGLEQDAVDAKTEMARQQARAATAERSLLELQQRLAHRRISKSDHDKLVASLRQYRGSAVNLTKLGDSEAAQFADDLVAVLSDARWHVTLSIIGTLSPPRYGLMCSVDTNSSAGRSLATVLRTLPTADVKTASHQGFIAEIFVGLKPPA
jgi:hypothetical protein